MLSRKGLVLLVLVLVLAMNTSRFSQGQGAGVVVDPSGVLRLAPQQRSADFRRAQHDAKEAMLRSLPQDMSKPAPLRFVSLNRLEQQIIALGGKPTAEMEYLGGITKIQYFFFIPETKDIVIAGPAEGWIPDANGEMVGVSSKRAVCQLQDLIVALRAFAPQCEPTQLVGCSIDPTKEGLEAMQKFIADYRAPQRGRAESFARGIRESLGNQNVRVDGVSPMTHAAHVLVAADLRMKLIGFNLEPSPVPMTTFVDVLQRRFNRNSANSLTRWFFTPDYQSVTLSEDGLGIEFSGQGVKLVDEVEVVDAEGKRSVTKRTSDPASQAFTRNFTENYSRIAAQEAVYGQLANFVDLLIVAAYMQQEGFYEKASWQAEFFRDEAKYATQRYSVPQQVEPIVTTVTRGNDTVAPTGGVDIDALFAIDSENVRRNSRVDTARAQIPAIPDGAWWWQ